MQQKFNSIINENKLIMPDESMRKAIDAAKIDFENQNMSLKEGLKLLDCIDKEEDATNKEYFKMIENQGENENKIAIKEYDPKTGVEIDIH